jgi:hypothetical protein
MLLGAETGVGGVGLKARRLMGSASCAVFAVVGKE